MKQRWPIGQSVYITTPAFGHPIHKDGLRPNFYITTPAFGHPF